MIVRHTLPFLLAAAVALSAGGAAAAWGSRPAADTASSRPAARAPVAEPVESDDAPDPFSVPNTVDVQPNDTVTSPRLLPVGYNVETKVMVSGTGSPEISVNEGPWTTAATIKPGQALVIRLTAAPTYNTAVAAHLTIGGVTTVYEVRTGEPTVLASCQAWRAAGYGETGRFRIDPNGGSDADAFDVTCKQDVLGGGWTLIGRFNGTTDNTLPPEQRNIIPYTEVLVLMDDVMLVTQLTCHDKALPGFALDETSGYNCTAAPQTSVRVTQGKKDGFPGGDYGVYQGPLGPTGGCKFRKDTKVWGRHYANDNASCTNRGTGEDFASGASWGTSMYGLYVR